MKGDKRRQKATVSPRNAAILVDSLAGVKTQEIADKYSIGRQQVSKILNHSEAALSAREAALKAVSSKFTSLATQSADTLEYFMTHKDLHPMEALKSAIVIAESTYLSQSEKSETTNQYLQIFKEMPKTEFVEYVKEYVKELEANIHGGISNAEINWPGSTE